MQVNTFNTNASNANYYLDKARENAQTALGNISVQRPLDSTNSSNMAIADALRSQSTGIEQGIANANDAIGVLQIADGALSNITKTADRINELSVAMNNPALGEKEKNMIRNEANALTSSINDSINSASFNGKNVFSGNMEFVTGNGTANISLNAPNTSQMSVENQQSVLDFISSVNSLRSDIGSAQQGIMSGINNSMSTNVWVKSSESELQNNDIAKNANDISKANLQINSSNYAMAFNIQNLQSQMSRLLG